ncbi:hypothetical protein [Treponema endosymbiont of Eucomonympha sp.]|uniref:hypothetical protein n=1 Tax=Treponema endosymbiont of Eucomonympha sp. TaxID=1580831 RepID=UPI000782153C|nr:hypothetical protein [Treponema endosymbiont of Eucomonympha sp.]
MRRPPAFSLFPCPAAAKEGVFSGQGSVSARAVVVADQYFAADQMLRYTGTGLNLDFLANAALWLSGKKTVEARKKAVAAA